MDLLQTSSVASELTKPSTSRRLVSPPVPDRLQRHAFGLSDISRQYGDRDRDATPQTKLTQTIHGDQFRNELQIASPMQIAFRLGFASDTFAVVAELRHGCPILTAPVSAAPALFATVRERPGPFRSAKTASRRRWRRV